MLVVIIGAALGGAVGNVLGKFLLGIENASPMIGGTVVGFTIGDKIMSNLE